MINDRRAEQLVEAMDQPRPVILPANPEEVAWNVLITLAVMVALLAIAM